MYSDPFVTPRNIDDKCGEWLTAVYRHLRPRSGFVLEPSKCALIVVDMLVYFANPGGRVYLPSTDAITPRIRKLLDLWRGAGNIVVFTRHCHEGMHDLGMLGKFFGDYIRCDESESEIIPELQPLPLEKVIRKNTYDAFHNTGLDEYLRDRAVEQVLVTGVLTQMCCETTARSAFVRNYEVYIAADALTTSSEDLHVASLMNLASSVAIVSDTHRICRGECV